MSLDFFGTASVNEYVLNHITGSRVRRDGRLGAGVGGNIFFDRYIGIGADAWSENTAHSFVNDASGSLILRIPLDAIHLAPYAFGGGGYQFETARRPFIQGGAGLDIRILQELWTLR